MVILKDLLVLLVLFLTIGTGISILIFAVDVLRWHDREVKVKVTPSNQEVDQSAPESEVITNADESGQYNTSAVLDLGR